MLSFNFSLKSQGVLGINARNREYIQPNNPRRFYPRVDDKVLTKKLAVAHEIPTPEVYALIEYQQQIKGLFKQLEGKKDFVIKPAHGSGGGGILVIADVQKNRKGQHRYIKASGVALSHDDITYHVSNILSGLYSLGGQADQAIIEYRVISHSFFDKITFQGVPDVRLVIYRGVPVMAMLRLPTRASDGKANLHGGGVGVGVDIATGMTTHAIQYNQLIDEHPDNEQLLSGLQLPFWDELLYQSARFDTFLGLHYIGVDMVIDQALGPMLLEVNARPGISIQVANQDGLKGRLEKIDRHLQPAMSVEDRIKLAKHLFASVPSVTMHAPVG